MTGTPAPRTTAQVARLLKVELQPPTVHIASGLEKENPEKFSKVMAMLDTLEKGEALTALEKIVLTDFLQGIENSAADIAKNLDQTIKATQAAMDEVKRTGSYQQTTRSFDAQGQEKTETVTVTDPAKIAAFLADSSGQLGLMTKYSHAHEDDPAAKLAAELRGMLGLEKSAGRSGGR